MFYVRLIWTSLRSLDSHFLRSLLATLGVLIGVSSVVACMSILEGLSSNVFRSFRSMGANVLFVGPEAAHIEGRVVGMAQGGSAFESTYCPKCGKLMRHGGQREVTK